MESPADEVFAVGNQLAKTESPLTGPNSDRENKMISEDKQISEIITILRLDLWKYHKRAFFRNKSTATD